MPSRSNPFLRGALALFGAFGAQVLTFYKLTRSRQRSETTLSFYIKLLHIPQLSQISQIDQTLRTASTAAQVVRDSWVWISQTSVSP